MNPTFVPSPLDDKLQIEAAVTKTATGNGASIDLGNGFAPGGLGMPACAVVNATAFDHTTGDETYSAVLQESDDNSSFSACGAAVSVTGTGVISIPGIVSKRYVRIAWTLAGTTPSITYTAWFSPLGYPIG
ncbi:MAG TPA: hypothetical protein VHQ47_17690 [Phycisphaerae bacterium]|nr:hypothetical protein [Phycisphaerae bacterium]